MKPLENYSSGNWERLRKMLQPAQNYSPWFTSERFKLWRLIKRLIMSYYNNN